MIGVDVVDMRGPLHRWTTGTGRPVVFLHPCGMDGRVWGPVVDALADVTAIVVDRPGHGGSIDQVALRRAADAVRSADAYAAHTAALRAVDDESDRVEETVAAALADGPDGPVTVVGYGDGGLLALDLAARGRARVEAVVTVDTAILPPPPDLDADTLLAMIEEQGVDLDAQRAVLDTALRTRDADAYAESALAHYDLSSLGPDARQTVHSMVRDNAFSALLTAPARPVGSVDLDAVAVPVHVVVSASTPHAAGALAEAMPRAAVTDVTVPERPTTLPLARPAVLARLIRDALPG